VTKAAGDGVGQGDADWASDSKCGNCADFSRLFIAMARGSKIPAKFEVGFLMPAKPGPVAGYHCWGWFLPQGKGWIPVDIAEANQRPQLTGRSFMADWGSCGTAGTTRPAMAISMQSRPHAAATSRRARPRMSVARGTAAAEEFEPLPKSGAEHRRSHGWMAAFVACGP